MKKYICLSFDDGRLDTYEYAAPIMEKYGLKSSIHVITSFSEREKVDEFDSAKNMCMSVDNCKELALRGHAISSHSDTHINVSSDISISLNKLVEWGIYGENQKIGFASPNSEINENNCDILNGIEDKLSYIRGGVVVRNRNLIDIMIYVLSNFLKSRRLFWFFYKKYIFNISKITSMRVLPSIGIKSSTTLSQLKFSAKKLNDGDVMILNFHSVIPKGHPGYEKDPWFYDADDFDELCRFIHNENNIHVCTIEELISKEKGEDQ